MFERYTDRARLAVVLAQAEAGHLGHDYVGTEHLLLGLIQEGSGIAARALAALGVSLDEARTRTEAIVGQGSAQPGQGGAQAGQSGHIPFTPRAKKVLELAPREARDLGHSYIGTEHLLLSIMREADGAGARVLLGCGVEFAGVRHQIRQLITGRRDDEVPPVPPRVATARPAGGEGDDLTRRLASFAARLTAIEERLRASAPEADS